MHEHTHFSLSVCDHKTRCIYSLSLSLNLFLSLSLSLSLYLSLSLSLYFARALSRFIFLSLAFSCVLNIQATQQSGIANCEILAVEWTHTLRGTTILM